MSADNFLKNATISTIIPCASEVNLKNELDLLLSDGIYTTPLSYIQQRDLLIFDEILTVYIVLQLVNCTDDSLKAHLPNVLVHLDVFAANTAISKTKVEDFPTKELIFSGFVKDFKDSLVIHNAGDDGKEPHNQVYVLWTIDVYLRRPRTRHQQPSVIFQASAALSSSTRLHGTGQDDFLPSLTAGSLNIFQPLVGPASDNSSEMYLPASRLLHVAPVKTEERVYNISESSHNPIRIVPVASAKIRYSRLNTYCNRPVAIASLDFEMTPFAKLETSLESIDLSLSSGIVENMGASAGLDLPILCRSRDDLTFVFKLTPNQTECYNASTTAIHSVLDIHIRAVVLISENCQPKISMRWKASIDFSLPLNPIFGGPSQVLQRNCRPASLSMAPSEATLSGDRTTQCAIGLGVYVSLSTPTNIEVAQGFDWEVFVVNRSNRVRKFAIVVIPMRNSLHRQRFTSRQSSSAQSLHALEVAHAAVDESFTFSMVKTSVTSYETELICLNPDLKLSPLFPGSCYAALLPMLPLSSGLLNIAAVKIVDLETNESMEIRDPPDLTASLAPNF
ncbi:hypothetical protein CIHG_08656 [Coccidioides immitis H538.4]|uniref:Trafficking protein particle complex II-specific subunit 65 IgD3 domain-containing protein n=1 Tax=Coccidioides immitis H538.4 TaxID=396776 RepID=A0A0J8S113_COCIT|nr:hypothetical protein CIHG_08656 [Coccidioides immitis H538.4]